MGSIRYIESRYRYTHKYTYVCICFTGEVEMSGVGVCNCLWKRNIILQPDPKDWLWDSNHRPSTLNKYATCQTVRCLNFTVFLPVDFNCLPTVDLGIIWNELRHFFEREKNPFILIFLHKKRAACLCGSGLFVPPAVPPEASQPGVPGGFSAGSRFSETPPEPLGFSDTAGGPMTSRAERLLGRRRVAGVVQYFLETLVLTTSQRLRS